MTSALVIEKIKNEQRSVLHLYMPFTDQFHITDYMGDLSFIFFAPLPLALTLILEIFKSV